MPTDFIGPNKHIPVRYELPRPSVVEFELTADRPVETYLLDTNGLELFSRGSRGFDYYGGYARPRTRQHQRIYVPIAGSFYFLVVNRDPLNGARVSYEVYF